MPSTLIHCEFYISIFDINNLILLNYVTAETLFPHKVFAKLLNIDQCAKSNSSATDSDAIYLIVQTHTTGSYRYHSSLYNMFGDFSDDFADYHEDVQRKTQPNVSTDINIDYI